MVEDKFIISIEKNQKLVELYFQVINYFQQQHPAAVISYTKSYVGIKFKGENNRCWFQTSDVNSFDFKFRKNINKKNLEDNVVLHRVHDLKSFQDLVPFINKK
jgi:hypothetical protein